MKPNTFPNIFPTIIPIPRVTLLISPILVTIVDNHLLLDIDSLNDVEMLLIPVKSFLIGRNTTLKNLFIGFKTLWSNKNLASVLITLISLLTIDKNSPNLVFLKRSDILSKILQTHLNIPVLPNIDLIKGSSLVLRNLPDAESSKNIALNILFKKIKGDIKIAKT